ncbi:MAG: lysylphosphatidylglycerol synthase transmembrane domain-containing protein [bacterium]|nr:lysylphosphatidylglycerol synthase transmembrane domain-containing protein [bacterium]
MKKAGLFILSIIFGIALFIAVLNYIGLEDIKKAFDSFSWGVIAIVIALSFVQMFIVIYRWKLIIESQGDKVPYRKLIAPKFVGYTISFLTPGLYVGGEPIRAYLLKKNTGIRLSKGFSSIIVDKILDFTYPLPFLIWALVYAIIKYDISWEAIGIFVFILFSLIFLLGVFYIQTYRGKGFFSSLARWFQLNRFKKLEKFINKGKYFENLVITFFKHKQLLFFKGLLLSCLGGAVILVQFIVILHALGVSANFVEILMMMVFMILAFLVPVPASIGSLEVGQAVIFAAIGHPASIGIAFVLIIRIAELGKLGVGLTFLSNVGLKFLRSIPEKNGLKGENKG